jgi:predicted HTH transcriptional regulator
MRDMKDISKLAELRKLLIGMERSMGLEDLTSVERDIYYAAFDIAAQDQPVRTTNLLSHILMENVSRPTFFRALKSLVNKGYLLQCASSRRGVYQVQSHQC